MVNIFDKILVRIGGESISEILTNNSTNGEIPGLIEEILSTEQNINTTIDVLCDKLHSYINVVVDNNIRKKILNFKRDLFNRRYNQISKYLEEIRTILPEEYVIILDNVLSNNINLEVQTELFDEYYSQSLKQDLKNVECFCSNNSLAYGLLLSSEQLINYCRIEDRKKLEDLSSYIGLWKYITRICTKTSPFSTFTNLGIAQLTNSSEVITTEEKFDVISFVRYNNAILNNIINLLKRNKLICLKIPIRLNSTCHLYESDVLFLTNNNNTEAFQKIQRNPAIELVLKIVSENQNICFGELVNELIKHIDSDFESITTYLFEVIQTGLLEFDFGISGLDPDWDFTLLEFVKAKFEKNDQSDAIIKLLQELSVFKRDYEKSDLQSRERIWNSMFDTLRQLLLQLHEAANLPKLERDIFLDKSRLKNLTQEEKKMLSYNMHFLTTTDKNIADNFFLHRIITPFQVNKKNMIYEDVLNTVNIFFDKSIIYSFTEKLNQLVSSLSFYCFLNPDIQEPIDFYKTKYNGSEVSLNEFYEEYYKNKLSKNASADMQGSMVKAGSKNMAYLHGSLREFIKKNRISRVDENLVDLDYSYIDKIGHAFRRNARLSNNSNGAFVQFYLEKDIAGNDKLVGVINSMMPGYGKLMSRFLHLFDPDITEQLREWNHGAASEGEFFAENSDGSFFNANLHPCLMPFEIEMPGGYNRLSPEKRIKVSDIIIKTNTPDGEPYLYYKNGDKINVIDLGFQAFPGRSNLYRLLCNFSPNNYFSCKLLCNAVNQAHFPGPTPETKDKIFVYPRIVYDDVIVLQRKQWRIPVTQLSIFRDKYEPSYLFRLINTWRKQLEIPDEIFVKKEIFDKREKNMDYKPQYINFLSPLSILAFIKLVSKLDEGAIFIEEMLPNSTQMLKFGGKGYVTEFLLQWQ